MEKRLLSNEQSPVKVEKTQSRKRKKSVRKCTEEAASSSNLGILSSLAEGERKTKLEVDKAEKAVSKAEANRNLWRNKYEKVRELNQELEVACVDANQRVTSLEDELKRRTCRMDALKRRISQLSNSVNSEQKKNLKLESEVIEARAQCHRLQARLNATQNELEEARKQLLSSCERRDVRNARCAAHTEKLLKRLRANITSLKKDKTELKAKVDSQHASIEAATVNYANMEAKKKKYDSLAKNRLRSARKFKARAKQCSQELRAIKTDYKPTRKLKDIVSERQQYRRKAEVKKRINMFVEKVMDNFRMQIPGSAPVDIALHWEEEGMVSINMRKGSTINETLKFVFLHDDGVSKRKLHEVHMAKPTSTPSMKHVNAEEKKMSEEVIRLFDIVWDENNPDAFHIKPEKYLRYLIKTHKIEIFNNAIHLLLAGDGRGTGNSFKSVLFQMVILNEGRKIYRADRQYVLSLLKGDEDRKNLESNLKPMLNWLEELQKNGLVLNEGEEPIDVVLHLVADGKFLKITAGMEEFFKGGDTENCLYCFCGAEDREEVDVQWTIEPDRWDNNNIGLHGRKDTDMFSFIPMQRRWSEGLHLVLRFCMDKMIKAGWTDILNDEWEGETQGKIYIENTMSSAPLSINSFEIKVGRSKDSSAEGKWCHRTLSYAEICRVAAEFDFASGYNKRPDRGALLQRKIREWILHYKDLQCWPGDGPKKDMNELFDNYSDFMSELIEGGEGEPGEDGFEEGGWPVHFMTPYAHTWVNHIPEMYDRSKALAHLFSKNADGSRGGLKPFRTDALERENLKFFHSYFQCLTRRPGTVIYEAGMAYLRKLINPQKSDRSTKWCEWCGKGYQQAKSHAAHEAVCHQRPVERDENDNVVLPARVCN